MIINHLQCVRHCATGRGGGGGFHTQTTKSCPQGAFCVGHTSLVAVMKRAWERGKQNCFGNSKEVEISSGWKDPFRLMRKVMCERGLNETLGIG